MPLYEVLCVANPRSGVSAVAQLLKQCTTLAMQSGGIVRGIEHMGIH